MITITHHSARYLALRNCYEHRDAIKALSDYPDVRFDAESKAWLVDNRMFDDLVLALGAYIAPLPVEFWLTFTPYEAPAPVKRRRTKQEIVKAKRVQQAAAGRFGRIVVDAMHGEA